MRPTAAAERHLEARRANSYRDPAPIPQEAKEAPRIDAAAETPGHPGELPRPRTGLLRCLELPAPGQNPDRGEAGPLLLLGLVNTLRAVEHSPAAIGRWLGVTERTVQNWLSHVLDITDHEGLPVVEARDGYLIRCPGFDAWLDRRRFGNVGKLRVVWLPIATLRAEHSSPVIAVVAAVIRSEQLGKGRTFRPSDRRRASEIGVTERTIAASRQLLIDSKVSEFTRVMVRAGTGRSVPRWDQKLREAPAVRISKKVASRRAKRAAQLRARAEQNLRLGGNPNSAAPGNLSSNTSHRIPTGSSGHRTEIDRGEPERTPVAVMNNHASLGDGCSAPRTRTAPQQNAHTPPDGTGIPWSRDRDRGRQVHQVVGRIANASRTDRTKLDRVDADVRRAIDGGTLGAFVTRAAAQLRHLAPDDLLPQLRHHMERMLLHLGVFDRSDAKRRQLAACLVSRGADLADVLHLAENARHVRADRFRALIAHRLGAFLKTQDRRDMRPREAPTTKAAPPASLPPPNVAHYRQRIEHRAADDDRRIADELAALLQGVRSA